MHHHKSRGYVKSPEGTQKAAVLGPKGQEVPSVAPVERLPPEAAETGQGKSENDERMTIG